MQNSFFLQPGEYEDFLFELNCISPVAYQIKFGISTISQGQENITEILSDKFVCPASFTSFAPEAYTNGIAISSYEWNDNHYEEKFYFQTGNTYTRSDTENITLYENPQQNQKLQMSK